MTAFENSKARSIEGAFYHPWWQPLQGKVTSSSCCSCPFCSACKCWNAMKCLCHVVLISNPLNIVVSYISYKYIINHSYWILLVAPPIHAGWICPVCSSSCGRSLLLLHRRAVTLAYLAARIEQLVWLKIGYIIPLNLMVYQCLIIIFPIKWPFWEVSAISRQTRLWIALNIPELFI